MHVVITANPDPRSVTFKTIEVGVRKVCRALAKQLVGSAKQLPPHGSKDELQVELSVKV